MRATQGRRHPPTCAVVHRCGPDDREESSVVGTGMPPGSPAAGRQEAPGTRCRGASGAQDRVLVRGDFAGPTRDHTLPPLDRRLRLVSGSWEPEVVLGQEAATACDVRERPAGGVPVGVEACAQSRLVDLMSVTPVSAVRVGAAGDVCCCAASA